MALSKAGPLGDVSGKLGGVEFAKGRGSTVIKKGKIRQSSTSNLRKKAQANHAYMIDYWKSLSDAQRNAWNIAARSRPKSDRFGTKRIQSGFQLFMSLQFIIYPFILPYPIPIPPHYSLSLPDPVFAEANAGTHLRIWTTSVGDFSEYSVQAYIGRFRSATSKGRCYQWQKIGMVVGDFDSGFFDWYMNHLDISLIEGETIAVKARFWYVDYWPIDTDLGTITVGP